MEMWDQARDSNEAYRELEIPEEVYSRVSDVVENDVTYRDEVDFLLSAIRLELREASAP